MKYDIVITIRPFEIEIIDYLKCLNCGRSDNDRWNK